MQFQIEKMNARSRAALAAGRRRSFREFEDRKHNRTWSAHCKENNLVKGTPEYSEDLAWFKRVTLGVTTIFCEGRNECKNVLEAPLDDIKTSAWARPDGSTRCPDCWGK